MWSSGSDIGLAAERKRRHLDEQKGRPRALKEPHMTSIRTSAAIVLLLTVCACKVGPNYKRPAVTVPDQYRGLAPDASTQAAAQPFADMQWAAVFQDEVLQGLIKEALTNNYDVRIAATRVLQANANLGITRADQLPSLNGSFGITNDRSARYPKAPPFFLAGLSLS